MYSFKEDPEGVKGKNVKNGNGLSSCKVGCRKQTGWELGLVPPFSGTPFQDPFQKVSIWLPQLLWRYRYT